MASIKASSSVNLDVDFVITYRFPDTDRDNARQRFDHLLETLARVGLALEVRNGENCSILVFVKIATEGQLHDLIYRSRVRDWLHGVRALLPEKDIGKKLDHDLPTNAERLRIVHHLITGSQDEGGAGVSPKLGQWKNVESIFALHDPAYNKEWIKKWSRTTFLKAEDLDDIRNQFGEKVAYYFAFTQSYFSFLIFPAAFGFSCWILLGHFSPVYAIFNGLWCVIFVEYWKRQELDLALRWGVKGASAIQEKRREFKHEKDAKDPITGEMQQIFPTTKRLYRQLLTVPFALIASLVLGTVIATCFGIEIFLSEVYNGPFKQYLVYIPTILLTGLIPTLSTMLTKLATQLNTYENYETTDTYQSAMTHKIFVLNFITSYLPVLLTAFVYVPFGSFIVPYLDIFSLTDRTAKDIQKTSSNMSTPKFEINSGRLRQQVIYFTLTAQIVNFAMEVIVPYAQRKVFHKYQELRSDRAAKKGGAAALAAADDAPEETQFLRRVRDEAELDVYDVTVDLREMVVQYGYLSLFSVVWPLTGCSFLVNNWIELRSDAVKICLGMQRPTPHRADSIGPWLDSLGFLTWFGSITSAALVYMFRNDGLGPDGTPADIKGWALMVTIFFSEHLYLIVRWATEVALSKIDSPGMQKERAERFQIRKRYLEESVGTSNATINAAASNEVLGGKSSHEITRADLEEAARQSTLTGSSPADRFWQRQQGWRESSVVGNRLIERMAPVIKDKKEQ